MHFPGVLHTGHGQQLLGQAHGIFGGLARSGQQGLRLFRLGVALGQRQLRLEGRERRAQLVRGVVQKAFADVDQAPQPIQVAVEGLDQGPQLARQVRRLDGRKIIVGLARQLLAKRLQRPDAALHAPDHQARSGQQQQALAAQGVPQNVLDQLLSRLHGFGHGDLDQRIGQARVFHDMCELRQAHGLVQVHPIVKLHQGKVLHGRLRTHGGIGQGRHPRQPLPAGGGDFVEQTRSGVVLEQVARGLHHVQLNAAIAPGQLFCQGAGSQVQGPVVGLVGRLYRVAIAHPGVHTNQRRQRQQDPAEQSPAQRCHGTIRWRRCRRHAVPTGEVNM